MKRNKPLPRSTKPIKRSRIKHRTTKRRALLVGKTQGALGLFFGLHQTGKELVWNGREYAFEPMAYCQLCGLALNRSAADPAHKWRRHHGKHEATEILAAHRWCHTWMDNKAHSDRERTAQADKANCEAGGVVAWTEDQKKSLDSFLKTSRDPLRGERGRVIENSGGEPEQDPP